MKIEKVMLSDEEEQFLPPTVVRDYYKEKTRLAVEGMNMMVALAIALMVLHALTWLGLIFLI